MQNIVKIKIYADPAKPQPTVELPDIPWYAGITALQAMIIGEALHPTNFSFRVIFRSVYGAFVDCIDGVADGDKPKHSWMFYVDGEESEVGVSEAILLEDANHRAAVIEWRYVDVSKSKHPQVDLKTKPLR